MLLSVAINYRGADLVVSREVPSTPDALRRDGLCEKPTRSPSIPAVVRGGIEIE